MDKSTRLELIALSRRFYEATAESFDASRQKPWPGWRRLPDLEADSTPLRVFDVGCGNGRFGLFLLRELERPLRYRGIDSSRRLLAIAEDAFERELQDSGASSALLEEGDVCNWLGAHRDGAFDVVALFGVLHHIPARKNRRDLLLKLAERVAPGGYLAVTWWMLHETPRFEKMTVPWSAAPGLEPEELEAGDFLLSWRGEASRPRYCHFPSKDELAELAELPGLELETEYRDDGPDGGDNLYRIFRRPAS